MKITCNKNNRPLADWEVGKKWNSYDEIMNDPSVPERVKSHLSSIKNNKYDSFADYHVDELIKSYGDPSLDDSEDLINLGPNGSYSKDESKLFVNLTSKLKGYLSRGVCDDTEISEFIDSFTFLDGYSVLTDSSNMCIEIDPVDLSDAEELCKKVRRCLIDLQNDF